MQTLVNTQLAALLSLSQFSGQQGSLSAFERVLLALLSKGNPVNQEIIDSQLATILGLTQFSEQQGSLSAYDRILLAAVAFATTDGIAADPVTITAGSPSYTIPNNVKIQPILLQNNATITLPAPVQVIGERTSVVVELTQDDTGGRTVTWVAPAGYTIKWLSSATAHRLVTAPNKVNWVQFDYVQGSTVIYASVVWQESQI